MWATRLEKCQSLEHVLLFRNDIVQNHDKRVDEASIV